MGAEKYEDRNWEKGIPIDTCIDACLRHINRWRKGERGEDHLAAATFWLFAIMHFEEAKTDDTGIKLNPDTKCEVCENSVKLGDVLIAEEFNKGRCVHFDCELRTSNDNPKTPHNV
jgi:hypothetical protein